MAIEIVMIPVKHAMVPATIQDEEQMRKIKGPTKFVATKQSTRSLQHHRLYFGGLLALTYDYWEPNTGLVAPMESETLKRFAKWLDAKSTGEGAVSNACEVFLDELTQSRSEKIETPHKSKEALHEWVKVEAGHCELVMTPSGIKKQPKSINFNAMSQEEFNEFYKEAFSVCWRFILSRTFESEEEAENAVMQLSMMG